VTITPGGASRIGPTRAGRRAVPFVGLAAGAALLLFLVLPVVALFVTAGPRALLAGLRQPLVGPALLLSLRTTGLTLALVVLMGTPLAYWLARTESRLAGTIAALCRLPIVVPPAVAGIALLRAFGRRGLLGAALHGAGIDISFTEAAVVMAQLFVAAPFFVEAGTAAFGAIDPRLLAVARTLGASPARLFFRIALPLARRGLVAGAAMAWARALGEFGATLMFAGNLSGRTQTLPLAIYTALESDLHAAQALSVLLVLAAFGLLAMLRGRDLLPRRRSRP
jgi:molybdate transport system permease protein